MWRFGYKEQDDFRILAEYVISLSSARLPVDTCNVILRCYNDENSAEPMLVTNDSPLSIRTCAAPGCWAQFIYQFSHELMHAVIRMTSGYTGNTCAIEWLEETICEAYSLFTLDCAAKEWRLCSLFGSSPHYGSSIADYLQNILRKAVSSSELTYVSYDELVKMNEICSERRSDRWIMRNAIYRNMIRRPDDIAGLIAYGRYTREDYPLLVDFRLWVADHPGNKIIEDFDRIQNQMTFQFLPSV